MPDITNDNLTGIRIPRLRSLVQWAKILYLIESSRTDAEGFPIELPITWSLVKGLFWIVKDSFYLLYRLASFLGYTQVQQLFTLVETTVKEVSEVDFNKYLNELLQNRLPPEFSEIFKDGGLVGPLNIEKLKFKVPYMDKLMIALNNWSNPDEFSLFFACLGFSPDETVDLALWGTDAAGYIMEPGTFGSELLDDIIGIFIPIIGFMDLAVDIKNTFIQAGLWYRDFAIAYNTFRLKLTTLVYSRPVELMSSILALLDGAGYSYVNPITGEVETIEFGLLTDSPEFDKFVTVLRECVGDAISTLEQLVRGLPDIPIMDEKLAQWFETAKSVLDAGEFSWFEIDWGERFTQWAELRGPGWLDINNIEELTNHFVEFSLSEEYISVLMGDLDLSLEEIELIRTSFEASQAEATERSSADYADATRPLITEPDGVPRPGVQP
jgi:hypothetical protein